MKRFFLFRGSRYYPSGGWEDFHGAFDTIEEAVKYHQSLQENYEKEESGRYDWYNIVDSSIGKIICNDTIRPLKIK